MGKLLPSIPAKRYFTIGEVAELCGVKPHVLRYWEQEFTQLRPMKRRGNRRYYQHHEVLMIRRIRDLLYDQGFTISGARNKLQELAHGDHGIHGYAGHLLDFPDSEGGADPMVAGYATEDSAFGDPVASSAAWSDAGPEHEIAHMRRELVEIRELLSAPSATTL
ncbi:MerR family transcriptional regulator [Ramlibacter sp. H39-3-26]|uniref:MerR family transcriptional regulator n=1 Tax=Curvibacter soli TaxID=3031331 RepID=UPI0023D98DB2|nr:MerR family transcriptional regulator [Ramlibacter sp. H39-3-26]MDF1483656.1 MerR family transcriptional regulator [Ramlibacter sp. H39-3-26]